jgi:uncharacterized membrane protein
MNDKKQPAQERRDSEPRWPAFIAIAAVGGLYTALPPYLIVGPRWLFLVIVFVLLVPTIVSHHVGRADLNKIFGLAVTGVVTLGLIISVALLISALPTHRESPTELLLSAASLWFTNVLVFALWYWRLDAGGPHRRDSRTGHPDGAFLFPQMTLNPATRMAAGLQAWSPNFVDYLFLAFNTSAALSPADVPVLARWAKLMMMLQAVISMTVIVLLAARAVNIL